MSNLTKRLKAAYHLRSQQAGGESIGEGEDADEAHEDWEEEDWDVEEDDITTTHTCKAMILVSHKHHHS